MSNYTILLVGEKIKKKEAALVSAGGNKLEAKGPFQLAPGTTVILQVKRGRPQGGGHTS